jgi:hypothetical protein
VDWRVHPVYTKERIAGSMLIVVMKVTEGRRGSILQTWEENVDEAGTEFEVGSMVLSMMVVERRCSNLRRLMGSVV